MAYDEGLTELMRGDLADVQGICEKKMFGGIAFMLNGNMVCGVHTHGGMYRVGKDRETAARAIDGAGAMDFTGRPMGGMINVTDEAMADDTRRTQWTKMALANALCLPPK